MKRKPSLRSTPVNVPAIARLPAAIADQLKQKCFNNTNVAIQGSLESFQSMVKNKEEPTRELVGTFEGYQDALQTAYIAAGFTQQDYEQLLPSQVEAGIYTMFAAGGSKSYAAESYGYQEAVNTKVKRNGVEVPVIGQPLFAASAMGYLTEQDQGLRASWEAFDDRNMDNHLPFSITFNVQAARQDAFGELFYPTVVATPDQNGIDILVKRLMVFNEIRHGIEGKPIDPLEYRVNAIKAYIDHTILAADYTIATPVYYTGNAENNSHFADPLEVAPVDVVLKGGEVLKTAPLMPGMDHNLISLSQTPAQLTAGNKDFTASLDHRITINKIYVRVTDVVDVGTPKSIIPVSTERTPRNAYQRPHDGIDKSLALNFGTDTIALTGVTLDIAGNATAAGTAFLRSTPTLASYVLHLGLRMNGEANVEVGTVSFYAQPMVIKKVYQKLPNGSLVRITDAAIIATLTARFTFDMAYAEPVAHLSNVDRRDRGLMVTTVEHFERFAIPLQSPITCPLPMTSTGTGGDVAAPINIARIRNSNNAVTKALAYIDHLDTAGVTNQPSDIVLDIEGPGRWMVNAYLHKENIDMLTLVQSLNSQDRRADVQAALVNKIAERVYDAVQKSGYMPALMSLNGNTPELPTVAIGTDTYTQQFLMINGDTRTISIGFNHEIETTQDRRMYGKILVTLVRKNITGVDILNFGNFIWMPELATELNMTRYNGAVKEVMIQPRSLHINTCPIAILFTLDNLSTVVTDQLAIPFLNV